MTNLTLLFRQVHPSWIREGRITSQAFKPTAKDHDRPSVYNGDMISAEKSWEHWTTHLNNASVGVIAVTVGECQSQNLYVECDGIPYPEHTEIIFNGLSNSQREKKAKFLVEFARDRGWQYRDDAE